VWLKGDKIIVIAMIFRTFLVRCLEYTRKSVQNVIKKRRRKMEKGNENRVTNVTCVITYGLKKAEVTRMYQMLSYIKSMRYISRHIKSCEKDTE
jgi:hypothetical protein